MHPVLFRLGPITIYTYGFFMALGFLAGISLARYEAERLGENPEKIWDLCFFILIFSIVGARLFYIITDPKAFLDNPLEIFKIWNGGLVFYGGFIGALATVLIYFKKNQMPLWKTTDILTPSLALGHFFGRLGCFFAGCCYGKECDLPWAVTFNHAETLAVRGIPLHPVQLYSSAANLLIFGLLWYFRRYKRFDGQLFWSYVLIYGIVRSILELFRGDFRGKFFLEIFSTSQLIGGILSVIAVFMLIILSRKAASISKKDKNHA